MICRSSQAKERIELQADFYASCLLMPRKLVFAAWDEHFRIASRGYFSLRADGPPFVEIARFEWPISATTFSETDDHVAREFATPLAKQFHVSADRDAHPAGKARAAASATDPHQRTLTEYFNPFLRRPLSVNCTGKANRRAAEASRSRRGISISPASCAAPVTSCWTFAPKAGARCSCFGIARRGAKT